MILDYIVLAFKNLRKRGLRSWLTMLGIFIGIAAVVSLISLGTGLQTAVTGQFASIDPDKLTIQNAETGFGPPGSTAIEKLNEHDKKVIENVNGVEIVISRLIRNVKVEYNDVSLFKFVVNVPEKKEEIDIVNDVLNVGVEEGRLLNENDRKKIVLGNDFRGDEFKKEIKVGRKLYIQGESFEVVGILKKGSSFTVNSVVLMPEEDLRRILDIGDEFDILVAQVKDISQTAIVGEEITRRLREDRNLKIGEEDFTVQTPQQGIQAINTILTTINLVVVGIAAISLLVGGIGIANTMYTSVLERTKEIGLMKAVGARNRDILLIFLFESAMLGLVGGLIGASIGIGLAFLVSLGVNSVFPGLNFGVVFSPSLFYFSILFALAIGTLSGILPAYQASKLNPVEALRS